MIQWKALPMQSFSALDTIFLVDVLFVQSEWLAEVLLGENVL
ncbi:hypothetical protein T12_2531 [Trichinella patagoniensis]|uniref:Uncharacterized protein n=1 Tax=Trichinella patagoniensis TaxID=990121 RepID=A0A0V0YU41_9BILA|nr:hypothetical protein T12_2531 [Trichinella patagoniensis]